MTQEELDSYNKKLEEIKNTMTQYEVEENRMGKMEKDIVNLAKGFKKLKREVGEMINDLEVEHFLEHGCVGAKDVEYKKY